MLFTRDKKGYTPFERPLFPVYDISNSVRTNMSYSQTGFTLVETLVAITVLLLVVVGPMTVAQQGIKNAYYANEQVTAVFLAQEAIEGIRALRDSNALVVYDAGSGDTDDWFSVLDSSCITAPGCGFNVTNGSFDGCGDLNSCELSIDGNGRYVHTAGPSTFTRKIYVSEATDIGGRSVRVEVSWEPNVFGGSVGTRSINVTTWIYDHYNRYGN